MTDQQKITIDKMRDGGNSYAAIANALGLSRNTVKSYCQRRGIGGMKQGVDMAIEDKYCPSCGAVLEMIPGRKKKKYCCDACRMKWWNAHKHLVKKKANYEYTCAFCKKPFTAYGNAGRKYCSHGCYIADRFGGGADE